MPGRLRNNCRLSVVLVCALACAAAGQAGIASTPADDGYIAVYGDYRPAFLRFVSQQGPDRLPPLSVDAETMKLSSEKSFFSLNLLDEPSQAYAIVEAARKLVGKGDTREAMKVFQMAVEKYPQALFRVSPYGVFVPVGQYCQRQILQLPQADVAFYRTLYDGRAKEAFEQARRQYSLIGMQEIVDSMLATSWGDNALLALGDAALDSGSYEEALQRYQIIRELFAGSDSDTPELALKIRLCQKRLGLAETAVADTGAKPTSRSALGAEDLAKLEKLLGDGHQFRKQQQRETSARPPSSPQWVKPLAGAEHDQAVFSHPVVAGDSLLYRHKNIVYCRSILNGETRWEFDLGGRVTWQNAAEHMFPSEELVVADGLVFTSVFKMGPSLVALDLITGQLKWAAGPMAAATADDVRLRFEAAPAIAPQTLYAGYIKDNIEGDTHFDSSYGVRAFDAATGRVLWDTEICRLAPGKFTTGAAVARRNRIRSFTSPPVVHQGVVYYNTNSGAVAALNARSGRVNWIMRYPYWPDVHDSAARLGRALWYNQPPLVLDGRLIVGPVDSPCLLAIDRATGKVDWTFARSEQSHGQPWNAYVVGPDSIGQLVLAFSGRVGAVKLLDPASGKVTWESDDPIKAEASPAMTAERVGIYPGPAVQEYPFFLGARPALTGDDRLTLTSHDFITPVNRGWSGHMYNIAALSLRERRIISQQKRYDSGIKAGVSWLIHEVAPKEYEGAADDIQRRYYQAIMEDNVPEDEGPPFMPYESTTFSRYGAGFELRMGPRTVSVSYDRPAVAAALAGRDDLKSLLARAELAVADNDISAAADLLAQCLAKAAPDDLNARAAINQQLYRVQLALSRTAIRKADAPGQVASALELWKRANTTAEEIQAQLALAEAYQQAGQPEQAARCLRNVIRYFGRRPFPVARLALRDRQASLSAAGGSINSLATNLPKEYYQELGAHAAGLTRQGLPLYLSMVSPLPRNFALEAGPLACLRLTELVKSSATLQTSLAALAQGQFAAAGADEQLELVQEFPGSGPAKSALDKLFAQAAAQPGLAGQKALWQLGEVAELTGLEVPAACRQRTLFAHSATASSALELPMRERSVSFEDAAGTLQMVLPRRDDLSVQPNLLLVGGRARKRLDNKFELCAVDMQTGQKLWTAREIRLRGQGQEPGFTEAFVHGRQVIVHGFYDVLAFNLADGTPAWRYQAPFDFEILHATPAGELLILSAKSHTLALCLPTANPNGEVVWEAPETGEPYAAPCADGERLISVRHLPSGVTARRLGTGRIVGRLELPELSRFKDHPLIADGPEELPLARLPGKLFLTDGWYYLAVDTAAMSMLWQRPIDNNDVTREPPLRLSAGGNCLVVLKKDYETPALYGFDASTGRLLWHSDPKDKDAPQPMASAMVEGGKVHGVVPGAGRGFTVVSLDAATGRRLSGYLAPEQNYQTKPQVDLLAEAAPPHVLARLQDNQAFEIIAYDPVGKGPVAAINRKGTGPWDTHGRVSACVQNGKLVLMSADELVIGGK